MPSNQRIKNSQKLRPVGAVNKMGTKGQVKVPRGTHPPEASEEVRSISKPREWKLLYAPCPFNNVGNRGARIKDSTTRASPGEKDPGQYKGLCKNCKKEKTCKLPKPEGGVWRCEDYE